VALPICIEIPEIPDPLNLTLPGGVQIERINLMEVIQPALTPLVPIFDIIDTVVAVFNCIKAIPDTLGPPPDPTVLAACLPDLAESRRVLNELVAYLRANPPHVRADDRRQGREARRAPGPRVAPARATAGLSSGQWVRVRLTEKREKKGKSTWFACHEPTDLTGPVQQSERLPADAKPGDELDLVVAIPSQQSFALRAPHAKDLAECDKPKGGGKGPKGKGRARKGRRR